MKKLILLAMLFIIGGKVLLGQCKPDQKGKDRMTKEERVLWGVEIVKRTLGNKLLFDQNSTFPSVVSMIGKQGDKYFIRFNLIITEKSAGRASFNAPFRGSRESTIMLGFLEGGEPLTLHFDEVNNDQNVSVNNEYMYTVTFTQYFDKESILKYKEILTSKTIDIIQLNLEGGKKMEGKVRDKNGEKMKSKYTCFYDFLESSN